VVKELLAGGPGAQREIKALFAQLEVGPITPEVVELTAQTISRVRGTDEAPRGLRRLPGASGRPTGSRHDDLLPVWRARPRGGRGHHGRRHRPGGGAGRPPRVACSTRATAPRPTPRPRLPASLDGLGGQGQAGRRARRARHSRASSPSAGWPQAAGAAVVVEAIVENLDGQARRSSAELEALLGERLRSSPPTPRRSRVDRASPTA
jgi:hypothetical protein